jgi:antitoxin YefM
MQILSISKAKDRLNELVDAAALTREQVTITKNGSPAAVLIGADEWESIQETLYWLSQPGIRESLADAASDVSAGRVFDEAQIRTEFGVPSRERWARVSFEVVFTATARRDLHRIPPRIVPAIVEFVFGDLAASPYRVGKPLDRELSGSFGARRGPYRALYESDDAARRVTVLRVVHRAEVYRPGGA